MIEKGFEEFLIERQIPEENIDGFVSIVEMFVNYVVECGMSASLEYLTKDTVLGFSEKMINEGLNAYDNYRALALYGRYTNNNDLFVTVLELIDGSEALDNLYAKVGESLGEAKRNEIFNGIEIPVLGTPSSQKPAVTQAVMKRLESIVDPEDCDQILSNSLRYLEDDWFLEERKKFEESKDIDDYLERKGVDFIAQLEGIKEDGGLFWTQEIDENVLDFVKSHPEIYQGVRDGDIIYEVKIPYMTREYLVETDDHMKRYYYCHCPWIRESLKTGDVDVSPTFCKCSAGFHKKPWEVIFDQPLKADIVETVVKGDPWCKIAIHLPEKAIKSVD
jgi:hypothetical protein